VIDMYMVAELLIANWASPGLLRLVKYPLYATGAEVMPTHGQHSWNSLAKIKVLQANVAFEC